MRGFYGLEPFRACDDLNSYCLSLRLLALSDYLSAQVLEGLGGDDYQTPLLIVIAKIDNAITFRTSNDHQSPVMIIAHALLSTAMPKPQDAHAM